MVNFGQLHIIISLRTSLFMIFDALANNILPVKQPGLGYIQNFITVKSLTRNFVSNTSELCGE